MITFTLKQNYRFIYNRVKGYKRRQKEERKTVRVAKQAWKHKPIQDCRRMLEEAVAGL